LTRLRLILDSNLYLNFLLSPNPAGTSVASILDAAAAGVVEVILPDEVIAELSLVIDERPHLRRRISRAELEVLLDEIYDIVTRTPQLSEPPPPIVRDPKDDYLVALAVHHAADYVVTRDKDLLSLQAILGVQFIDPVLLLALLRERLTH
jgi:putative PIN family toxin of toxin-antitoxin system